MKNEAVQKFWVEFCEENQIDAETPYQTWYFGSTSEMAKELLELVLEGKKTATASLVWSYDKNPQDVPVQNGLSVVTDFEGNPKCVLQITEIRVLPFNEVDEKFAFDEGEGDQSLDYWREVHWDFFAKECIELGKNPDLEMPIICERFKLLYSQKTNELQTFNSI